MKRVSRSGKGSNAHSLTTIPPGKLLCYVTGKLRLDKPEENIRQRWARSLVEEYGYRKQDMGVNVPVRMGREKKYADIAVFLEGKQNKQENIFLIVEAKRADVKATDRKLGIEQLKSYMSACLNCRYGLWVGESKEAFEKVEENGLSKLVTAYDIPRRGHKEIERPKFEQLKPAHDLKSALKRCHNYIAGNQGLSKEEAFHELLKVIFCKVHDERQSGSDMRFFVRNIERRSIAGQLALINERIAPLFEEVKTRYTYIFPEDDAVKLSPGVLAYIVSEFQGYSFLKTETDIKGEAYEELVGGNLRGDRGEFFTPRDVCDMAVSMALATYPEDRRSKLRILDPACGTGGFLVSVMNFWRGMIYKRELDKWGSAQKAVDETAQRLRDTCDENLYGIDIRPLLVRACQMNLVMHGNGSMNAMSANSLWPPGEWPRTSEQERRLAERIQLGSFDIVVTNPPFGSRIPVDDSHVLAQYEISRFDAVNVRTSMPPEQVFVERCIQLVKPGGRVAIVLPDSILNNPGLLFLRKWLLTNAQIIASVDLPPETFAKYGGARNTSVLLVRKKSRSVLEAEARGAHVPYVAFMSNPRRVGYDLRGDPVYLRTPSGEEVLNPVTGEPIRERHLPIVAQKFTSWLSEHKNEVLSDE